MNKTQDPIAKYISILYRSGNSYLSKRLSKYNIGSGQHTYLIYLHNNDGITQEELSSNLYIDKGTTAKALKKLEQEGYVVRNPDEKDKRAVRVYLTEKANSIMRDLYTILEEWNNALTADFSIEEKELALKFMKRMVENKNSINSLGEDK